MKYSLNFLSLASAQDFIQSLKEERNLESSLETVEKDDKKTFIVSYDVSLACLDKTKTEESKASAPYTREELESVLSRVIHSMHEEMNWQSRRLNSRMEWLEGQFYKHEDGHLPKIEGAGKMEKALKALGLEDDYRVEKRVIFAKEGVIASYGE